MVSLRAQVLNLPQLKYMHSVILRRCLTSPMDLNPSCFFAGFSLQGVPFIDGINDFIIYPCISVFLNFLHFSTASSMINNPSDFPCKEVKSRSLLKDTKFPFLNLFPSSITNTSRCDFHEG